MKLPNNTAELDDWLSTPSPALVESLESIDGDILVLGAAGKMGPSLCHLARRALPESRRVIAVSRFSDDNVRRQLEEWGVSTIRCDLLNREAVAHLPDAANVIFMAGHKFGTSDRPELTWAMNAVVPAIVAERYRDARIVAFSTGCVYPFVPVTGGGAVETDALGPSGEYANSCVARERVFTHYSRQHGTPVLLFRLNYAIDLRYGVLHDIATKVLSHEPVDVTMGHVNVIWQGDANARALRCLAHTTSPPQPLNVTGKEVISVRDLAVRFGERFGVTPEIRGEESETAWLADATRSFELFGDVGVSLDEMIDATAHWLQNGGTSLGKPTHFEARDGKF